MKKTNYAIFILTNGRPDNVITYKTLKRLGYTGKIYLIIDDEDDKKDEYISKFGEEVIVFSKKDYEGKFDIMDNFGDNKVIVYARNACYDIARKLKLDYFLEYEDDYTQFQYRYIEGEHLKGITIYNLDAVIEIMIKGLYNSKIDTLAFTQGGDFIGGAPSFAFNHYKRKAMNSFIFKVNKDPKDDIIFVGRMNDDVNTYISQGKLGKIFLQIGYVSLVQVLTQQNEGGNTEAYKRYGTYTKSFYSVMIEPSCCKISTMGVTDNRVHHKISWNNAVPKIIQEKYKI